MSDLYLYLFVTIFWFMVSIFFIVAIIAIIVWYTAETPANKKYYRELSSTSNENNISGREERSEDAEMQAK